MSDTPVSSGWRSYDRMTRDKNVALDEFAWCSNCEKIVRYRIVEMGPEPDDCYAQDICCQECHYVIATFHEKAGGKPDRNWEPLG
jgi:hypothetical protein